MKTKKLLIFIVSIVLAFVMSFALTAFVGCGEEEVKKPPVDNSKPHLPDSEYDDEEILDNTPEDPGTLVSHVIEAEDMVAGSYCRAADEFFDLSFGGNVLVRGDGASYTVKFTSSEAYKVKLVIYVTSAFDAADWIEKSVSDMVEIVVNGRTPSLSEINVPAGSPEQMRGGNIYTCVQEVEVPISIAKGQNTLSLYTQDGVIGIDRIDLRTSAEIDFESNAEVMDKTAVTVAVPTAEEEGKIVFECKTHGGESQYVLPALKDGNGYTVETDGGKTNYSFVLHGEKYTFSSDGTYSLPEGVGEVEPEGPDYSDPEPDMPHVNIYGKYFFHPDSWQLFEKGTEKGAKPTKEGQTLAINDGTRFDFFYVAEGTHIADKSTNLTGKKSFYGQDYTWKIKMSATKAFTLGLFTTKSTPMRPDAPDVSAGCMNLYFDGSKVTLIPLAYSETPAPTTEAEMKVPLDGTEFEVAITVNRLSDNYLRFGISVDGKKAEMKMINDSEIFTCDKAGNIVTYSTGMYGQRISFIPDVGGKITVSNVALPGRGYAEPQGEIETPEMPSAVINGKDFFAPSDWTTFASGSVKGSVPVPEEGKLKFEDASRFEFFYVSDGVHIADQAPHFTDKSFYGKEYVWTLDMSANGAFSMLMFANNNFVADLNASLSSSNNAGTYLTFENGKLTAYHMQYGKNEKIGEAAIGDILNGKTFSLAIKVVRVDDNSVKYSLSVDGTPIEFTAAAELTVSAVNGSEITLSSPTGGMFGQRLCVVPATGSIVTISGLELPEAQS